MLVRVEYSTDFLRNELRTEVYKIIETALVPTLQLSSLVRLMLLNFHFELEKG